MSLRKMLRQLWRLVAIFRIEERPDPARELFPRYLDGTLSAEGVRILNDQLARDARLRREFAAQLLNEELLRGDWTRGRFEQTGLSGFPRKR